MHNMGSRSFLKPSVKRRPKLSGKTKKWCKALSLILGSFILLRRAILASEGIQHLRRYQIYDFPNFFPHSFEYINFLQSPSRYKLELYAVLISALDLFQARRIRPIFVSMRSPKMTKFLIFEISPYLCLELFAHQF